MNRKTPSRPEMTPQVQNQRIASADCGKCRIDFVCDINSNQARQNADLDVSNAARKQLLDDTLRVPNTVVWSNVVEGSPSSDQLDSHSASL
jgi:hypothetical protein